MEQNATARGAGGSSSGGGGGGSDGGARQPITGGGASLSPPASDPGEGRRERRLGPGATGAGGGGGGGGGGSGDDNGYGEGDAADEDNRADAAYGPTDSSPARPTMGDNSSASGDGDVAASSVSGEGKGAEGKKGGGGGVTGGVPKVHAEPPGTKSTLSSAGGDRGSVLRKAAAASSEDSGEEREDHGARSKEKGHSGDEVSRERDGNIVSGLPPPSSMDSPSTAQSSATAGGEGHAAAAGAAAAPGPDKRGGENAAKVVRFATTPEGGEDSATDGNPASPGRPAETEADNVPPFGGDDWTDTSYGTDALFQPSMPANAAPRPPAPSSSARAGAGAAGGGAGANNGAIEEQGGFVGGGGGGGGLSSSSYLGDMDEDELGQESERLKRESNRAQRDAETVTEEMKEEVSCERLDACTIMHGGSSVAPDYYGVGSLRSSTMLLFSGNACHGRRLLLHFITLSAKWLRDVRRRLC